VKIRRIMNNGGYEWFILDSFQEVQFSSPKIKFFVDSLNKNDDLSPTHSRRRSNINRTLHIGVYLKGSAFFPSKTA
jgi:hypothetical protein